MKSVTLSILCSVIIAVVSQRPFYNIAHMVNSIEEIDYYVEKGANAIEADVTYSSNGTTSYIFHGVPCDCFRKCNEEADPIKYLEYVRSITTPGAENYKSHLALLFLDSKLSDLSAKAKTLAGRDLAKKLIKYVFEDATTKSQIKVLLSIGRTSDYHFVFGFLEELKNQNLNHLNDKIGWDIGLNEPLHDIRTMWQKVGVTNIWQGDGITNCLSPIYYKDRLISALEYRNELDTKRPDPYVAKVYHWTIDLTEQLKESLRYDVDGIITNHPERLVKILKKPEFSSRFRLATTDDNPWERITSD